MKKGKYKDLVAVKFMSINFPSWNIYCNHTTIQNLNKLFGTTMLSTYAHISSTLDIISILSLQISNFLEMITYIIAILLQDNYQLGPNVKVMKVLSKMKHINGTIL